MKRKEREAVYTAIITLLAELHQLDARLFKEVDSLAFSRFSDYDDNDDDDDDDDDDNDDDDDSDSASCEDEDLQVAPHSNSFWEWQVYIV